MGREVTAVALTETRPHEATAVAAFLHACDAGLGGTWFTARYRGECALTHATIRPGHQIAAVGGAGAFVRKDAIEAISIRGCESIERVLCRFAWASREVAAEWVATGDDVLLLTASTLKPKVVQAPPGKRFIPNSCTLDKVTALHWRSVAFMLRRCNHLDGCLPRPEKD